MSAKFGDAVVRNRVKRLIHEVFDKKIVEKLSQTQMIILPRQLAKKLDVKGVKEQLQPYIQSTTTY
jgi:ribonuclease P protein component